MRRKCESCAIRGAALFAFRGRSVASTVYASSRAPSARTAPLTAALEVARAINDTTPPDLSRFGLTLTAEQAAHVQRALSRRREWWLRRMEP